MFTFDSLQAVDNTVKEKISCLMNEGVTQVSEMKRHIKSFSRKELKMTDEENRRFFPLDKDIRNIMEYNKGQTRYLLMLNYYFLSRITKDKSKSTKLILVIIFQ